jgi:hypothetical protein
MVITNHRGSDRNITGGKMQRSCITLKDKLAAISGHECNEFMVQKANAT